MAHEISHSDTHNGADPHQDLLHVSQNHVTGSELNNLADLCQREKNPLKIATVAFLYGQMCGKRQERSRKAGGGKKYTKAVYVDESRKKDLVELLEVSKLFTNKEKLSYNEWQKLYIIRKVLNKLDTRKISLVMHFIRGISGDEKEKRKEA